jgi:hypothetical protein
MDEKLLALLEKSGLFSGSNDSFFAKPEVILMKDFRFWLPNCFCFEKRGHEEDVQLKNFKYKIQSFFKRFFEAWAKYMHQVKEVDWEKHAFAMTDFFVGLDTEKLFRELQPGEKAVEIAVPVTDAVFSFRRFGDILAFDISRVRQEKEDHVAGRKVIESLCRDVDPNNNQGVYELVRGVRVSVSLPYERVSNSAKKKFDFKEISEMIRASLPYVVKINFAPASSLIEKYTDIDRQGMFVSRYFSFGIYAKLVHKDAKGKEDISSEHYRYAEQARIWRSGNVEELDGHTYAFKEGDDLILVLSLESSLPDSTFLVEASTDSKFHGEQFALATAGSIFLAGICSAMCHFHLKNHLKLNPIE